MSLYFVSGPWFQIATIVFQLYFNYDIKFNILYKQNMRHGPQNVDLEHLSSMYILLHMLHSHHDMYIHQ